MGLLPTQKNKPETDPMRYSILLYGPTKVGKTTFASHADGAVFLATEPGTKALEVYSVPVADWPTLLKALGELASGGHDFKTVVIDTIDNAYQMCQEHVCKENGWAHPSDGPYGKGWSAVAGEFKRVLLKLANMPFGVVLISHSMDKEIETRTGSYSKTTTTLPESARKIVIGLMDLVLLCDLEVVQDEHGTYQQKRIIRTKPSASWDAGDRTGRLPDVLPLDYGVFLKAFTIATQNKKDK
jgi:hypothetical protein